jgi:hypothetical protein
MASDVKSVRVTTTGTAYNGPARLKALWFVTEAGAPRITLTDGSGGPALLDLSAASAADTQSFCLPDAGIRFETSLHVGTLTNITSLTLVYG